MIRRKPLLLLTFYLVLAIPVFSASDADESRIKQFRWSETPYGFRISAVLQRGFHRDLEEAISAGIPASITYYLKFKQYRWYWDNKVLFEARIIHQVQFDTLRKTFTVKKFRDDAAEPFSVTTTDDIAAMRDIMSSIDMEIEIAGAPIKLDRQYYFSLRAEIETTAIKGSWNDMVYWASNRHETPINRLWLPVEATP